MVDDIQRDHTQEQEHLSLLHEQKMLEAGAIQVHQLALLDATREVDLANALARNNLALARITHQNETEKSWTATEQRVSSWVTYAWILAALGVLIAVIIFPGKATAMTGFIAILTLMYNLAGPAATRILGNVINKVKSDEEKAD